MKVLRASTFIPFSGVPCAVIRSSNDYFDRHSHEFLELVLVIQGRAEQVRYEPNSEVGVPYDVTANDLFLVPMGWSHGYRKARDFVIYNVLYLPELFEGVPLPGRAMQVLSGTPATLADELVSKIHLRAGERELIENCLREVSRELTSQRAGFEMMARAKMMEALGLAARVAQARDGGNGAMSLPEAGSPVAAAAVFMEERFSQPITLHDIAGAAHLSPQYLCEVFKSAFGTSVGQYLTQLRLEHARFLLSSTGRSITEVAAASGFADSSYFTRVFRAATGQTPRQFRQQQGR